MILQFLVEAMLEAQASAGASNAEHILLTISATFGYADVKSYLQVSRSDFCVIIWQVAKMILSPFSLTQ